MRYTITNQHINFFSDNGFIDFEGIFQPKELSQLHEKASALKTTYTSDVFYKNGRDLWRKDDDFKAIAFKKSLAKIASELTNIKPLRLAFDQLYLADNFFQQNDSLGSYFPFKTLACLVLIQISSDKEHRENSFLSNDPLGATFIKPYKVLSLDELNQPDSIFYILGYSPIKTLYVKNELDPNTHFLKKFGYSFGDFLSDKYHPIIS